ncbi:MAG TPA: DUF333 domain-containing protein [Anaerolineae bacterium]|nr:DUF333 domain-containing protein [Anaerolineae bacterium]
MTIRKLFPMLILLLLAASCAPKGPVLPNPASLVCEQQGAELDIRVVEGQAVVFCQFKDGSECEEWDYYYGRCTRTPPEPGLPNPASVHCEEQSGILEIRTEDAGQVGYCLFADGSECEEWAFFNGECAPTAALPGLANPASVHCEEQGGILDIRTEDAGEVAYCLFEDGSECEEWAFFNGECAPAGTQPALPNPAAVHCEEQGGILDIRTEDAGEIGYCLFEDGSECEEWAFFNGECAPAGTQPAMPNPAAVHCEEQGGTIDIRSEESGEVGYCIFDDGSECEEWAFLRGDCPSAETPATMDNAATAFCLAQGGTVQVRTQETGNVGYCLFADDSECEVWSLWLGDCVPSDQFQPPPDQSQPPVDLPQPIAGQYQPLAGAGCSDLLAAMTQTLGAETASREAAFQDYVTGQLGTGCQMTAIGTGLDFESFTSVAGSLTGILESVGWVEDFQYRADGPTGTATALRLEDSLCLLQAGWAPSPDADCPTDAPISACDLAPEQQLYTIDLFCAQYAPAGP